jgi:hypothetical protein
MSVLQHRTLFVLVTVLLLAAGAPGQRERTDETQVYFTFVINCHDFVCPRESGDTLLRLVSLFEARGVRGDFYLTAPLVETYLAERPDVIDRLRDTGQCISYHIRAPHPVTFRPTLERELAGLAYPQLLERLRAYETHGWDLTTGAPRAEGEGGYALVKRVFDGPPVSLGLNPGTPEVRWPELAVLRELGARMAIFSHEGGSDAAHPLVWRRGVLERPSDFSITRAASDSQNFWWNRVQDGPQFDPAGHLQAALSQLDADEAYFAQSLIHENNFYADASAPWSSIYFTGRASRKRPLPPPYDLSHALLTPREPAHCEAIWTAYDRLLDITVSDPRVRVVTSADLVAMVEPCKNPAAGYEVAVRKATAEAAGDAP